MVSSTSIYCLQLTPVTSGLNDLASVHMLFRIAPVDGSVTDYSFISIVLEYSG